MWRIHHPGPSAQECWGEEGQAKEDFPRWVFKTQVHIPAVTFQSPEAKSLKLSKELADGT